MGNYFAIATTPNICWQSDFSDYPDVCTRRNFPIVTGEHFDRSDLMYPDFHVGDIKWKFE